MINSHGQHDDSVQAFRKWILSSEAGLPGVGGRDLDTTCVFIPHSNLQTYFERPRQLDNILDAILDSQQRHAVDADYVRENYLRCFATLLCIGEGPMIHHFLQQPSLQDQHLPFRTRPDDFPLITPDRFEDFKRAQWQFCASDLKYNMNDRFKEEDILPIISKEEIGEGGSAVIYKIVVDEGYNKLRPRGHVIPDRHDQHKNTFVLKTYRDAEAQENYKSERDAYMKLRWAGKPSPHIIAYYGGFVHGNSYNLILEYADQGTLEMFMKETDPPSSVEEALLFWDRLFDVTHGIMTIHGQTGPESSASQILNGWHQDVKPANILVFGGKGPSPYDCHFKIADLGLTHFKPRLQHHTDPSDLDAFGTRAYGNRDLQSPLANVSDEYPGAPETHRAHLETQSSPLQITPAVDVWSIGCVYSEASVWAQFGWKRVGEYRRQRSLEIEQKGGGEGEHIFHYDNNILTTVDNIHRDILSRPLTSNHITRLVLDRLVGDMLQHESRPHMKWIFEKSKRLIKEVETRFSTSVAGFAENADNDFLGFSEARNRTRSSPKIPSEHIRGHSDSSSGGFLDSRLERELPQDEPYPPDEDFAPPPRPSRSQTTHERHDRKPTSDSKIRHSNGTAESSKSGRQSPHIASDTSPRPSSVADTHENSRQKLVEQLHDKPIRPTLSIGEGHEWKKKKKEGKHPGLPGAENLPSLYKRDHIFVLDNSATMEQYKGQMQLVLSLLAFMLKPTDTDGLDTFFTQVPQNFNSKKSSKIAKSVYDVPFMGVSDMRGRLQSILQEHTNKFDTLIPAPKKIFGRQPPPQPQKPLSFYILTDAKWQPTDVEGLIKDLVQKMIDRRRPKEHVAIQFIRFGEDAASIAKLDRLDRGLGLKARGMDIVDHTYWDDNVWKLLLGALNDWYDDDDDDSPLTP